MPSHPLLTAPNATTPFSATSEPPELPELPCAESELSELDDSTKRKGTNKYGCDGDGDGAAASTISATSIVGNRLYAVLLHVPFYSFEGPSRLASDVGVSRSTICRLMRGTTNPSYRLVEKVTAAISQRMGKPIDARDLFATDNTYPTASACGLCGCRGCLPPWAWDERRDRLRPEWEGAKPGDWSVSKPMHVQQGPTDPIDPIDLTHSL